MRYIILLLIITFNSYSFAGSSLNLAIPNGPQSYMSDKFRAGDLDCSNAIGSATQLEFGVTGIISEDNPYDINSSNDKTNNFGVYSRIVIPLGAKPKKRINCSELFELELQKKRLEVMRLESELKQLRELQFAN